LKVLVTGGCGFLGSHICERYRKMGEQVVSYDNMTKYELLRTGYNVAGARLHNWNLLKKMGVTMVKEDIRHCGALLKAARGCDYIINTAAQPSMTIAIEDPRLDITTNVMGVYNVLEAARKQDIPVVHCSTIHVYGNAINDSLKEGPTRFTRDPPSIGEDHPNMQGAISPLHASKRSSEVYVQAYIDSYGLKAAAFRLTGMYGPRQFGGEDHGWVANVVIRTMLGLPITVFGTDKQVRDILYVSDAALAFERFYKRPTPGIYNIGGGVDNMISLGECIQTIREITGKKQKLLNKPARLGDLWYFACDISKAQDALGWRPSVSNREGIGRLIGWVEGNRKLFGSGK
jgi:CDP-paratose 2-epimerase